MAIDDTNESKVGASPGSTNAGGTAGGASPPPGAGSAERGFGAASDGGSEQGQAEKPSMLPALSVPKGGGAIRAIGEKFSVNAATGTASLSVPLPASPGRGGFGPQVDLNYDSGHGNGPFGLGFALAVPAITRKSDKGLPRYYDAEESDEYILSGAEDLVPNRIPAGASGDLELEILDRGDRVIQRYHPRIEGLFARIERHTAKADGAVHWVVTTKDNVTHSYGRSAASQVVDPDEPRRIFSWLLEESRDDRGNIVRYEYKAEDGKGIDPTRTSERSRFRVQGTTRTFVATAQRYLKRALYGNFTPHQPTDFLFEMVFDYGEHQGVAPTPVEDVDWSVRIDPFSNNRAGFEVRTYRLCRRVLMFHRLSDDRTPLLVRATELGYKPGRSFTYLETVKVVGYLFNPDGTLTTPLEFPTLELAYHEPQLNDQLSFLPPESLEGLRGGVDGITNQWLDLDGEGIPGVLIDSGSAWYYKANAGTGRLTPPRILSTLPSPSTLTTGVQQLQDLGGDGQLDLVAYDAPLSGYASRTPDGDFESLRPFPSLPNINWRDPNLRFIDIDGDGLGDVLIAEDQAFVWYRSKAKDGFEPTQRIVHPADEDKGPAVVFADGTQSIQLADMTGDGLVDIVRVRNGEVCYWPNLGYGRFGPKVTVEGSPLFAGVEEFDARRIRFGDVDGSGTSDIFYLGRAGVALYTNESGNRLSAATPIRSLPVADSAGEVSIVDLLGSGTASLVWTSSLPGDQGRPVMYVDLMGGVKPHLLRSVVNNLGAETRVTYAPSTKFYLADKAAGIPWITRLAFPVHVVERIDRIDAISNTHLVSTYSYHHGFFDGVEREFRGFARVEQVDAEEFAFGTGPTQLFQAPTRTVTWFHTGAWLEKDRLEAELAKEYYPPGPKYPVQPGTLLLPDTILTVPEVTAPATPVRPTIQDEREAARALRGQMLHQEIYAADAPVVGASIASRPFVITEQSFEVRLVQTSKGWRHGVFLAFPRETVTIQTERNPIDPRVSHELILDVDEFGNVTQRADIAYGRASPAEPEQGRAWATLDETRFINHPGDDFYRLGLQYEEVKFELTGLPGLPVGGQGLFTLDALRAALTTAQDFPYDATPTGTGTKRRMLDHKQQLYYANDATGAILAAAPLGQTGSLALPFESYQLALTEGLVSALGTEAAVLSNNVFNPATLPSLLLGTASGEGHYVQRLPDSGYWTASGQLKFDATRFYVPIEAIDAFGQHSFVRYDGFTLLMEATKDALGNVVRCVNDYRVLAPVLVTDANLNRVAVAFDALGMITAEAVMGKETAPSGDTLAAPTIRREIDLLRWQNPVAGVRLPAVVHSIQREVHGQSSPVQHSYSYSDGFGRTVMQKTQAEPDPLTPLVPRWVGTGRIVFNNKGSAVKRYEPFFSATAEFEDEPTVVQTGVTPIFHYDALDRLVRTDLPNGTISRVVFDVWMRENWDPNDTVLESTWYSSRGSPPPDGPEPQSDSEQRAAWLAAQHRQTPTVTHLDAMGRPFLVIEHNRAAEDGGAVADHFYRTRTTLDVEGNTLAISDARQDKLTPANPRAAVTQRYDVLSRRHRTDSADGGERLMLPDVGGKVLRRWDSRGQITRHRYDELQRLDHVFVQRTEVTSPPQDLSDRLLVRTVHGEALDPAPPAGPPGPAPVGPQVPSAAQALNLRGQVFRQYDCAGANTNDRFDFRGNIESSTRRLAKDFQVEPTWNALDGLVDPVQIQTLAETNLETIVVPPAGPLTIFTVSTTYDALNRVTSRTTPDGSIATPTYNPAGLLEQVHVAVRGGPSRPVIHDINYNARGQRLLYEYADPTSSAVPDLVTCRTVYTYDPFTFRLATLVTTRLAGNVTLQDLTYTHDPVGNIVEVDDAGVFATTVPSSKGLYVFDAVYRVIQASGREHPGQSGGQPGPTDADPSALPNPNDLQALVAYTEFYRYDRVGNIEEMSHISGGGSTQWSRRYQYATDSNRLTATSRPGDAAGTYSDIAYAYTAHGSLKQMPHLPSVDWDYADRMQHARRGVADDVFFTYDGGGERVRKVWLHGNNLDERIYVAGWETFRHRVGTTTASPVTLERETLHVMDDQRRVAMVETKTVDVASSPTAPRWRFQLDNHLGSSVLELDATGNIITYEEYHPFGTTAFHATDGSVSRKRYRYTGKEKDEETGLYYHGARYYAPWLARWTATDPIGFGDGMNLYRYARNNPLLLVDRTGEGAAENLAPKVAEEAVEVAKQTVTRLRLLQGGAAAGEAALGTEAGVAAAGLAPELAPAAIALGYAAAVVAAYGLSVFIYMQRTGSIVRYGNPFNVPRDEAFPLQKLRRPGDQELPPEAEPDAPPDIVNVPEPAPQTKTDKKREPRWGRIYVTYTKYNVKTERTYSGRTSAIVDLNNPLRELQARAAVAARDLNHHIDEQEEPGASGFLPAVVDKYAVGTAVDYKKRYNDVAYLAIRGREQQLIDFHGADYLRSHGREKELFGYKGGARSDTRPPVTENAVRGVARDNRFGEIFHAASNLFFGPKHPYTGYVLR